jgi:hypothetical protein
MQPRAQALGSKRNGNQPRRGVRIGSQLFRKALVAIDGDATQQGRKQKCQMLMTAARNSSCQSSSEGTYRRLTVVSIN